MLHRLDYGRIAGERRRADAVAQPRRLVTGVVVGVPEVPAGARAVDLGPGHEERPVGIGLDSRWIRRLEEGWPSRARLELRRRIEQLGAASGASVHARPVLVPV